MATKKRNRKSEELTDREKTAIRKKIDSLPTKADAMDLLKVKTYNTIDKIYYKGKASPDLIKRVRKLITPSPVAA